MKMSVDQTLRKARALSTSGQREEAARLYQEVLNRFPGNKSAQAEFQALFAPRIENPPQPELDALVALYTRGEWDAALARASALCERYPNGEILHNIAGALRAGLGQLDGAIADYRRAVTIAPDYFEAHNNLGNALKDMGQLQEALASFEQATALNPVYAQAHMNCGIVLDALARPQDALQRYAKAISLNPRLAEAYNNRGNTLQALHRSAEARADFETAIQLQPDFASAHVNLGNLLKEMRRPEEALARYDHAIALSPRIAEAHHNRGAVLKDLKRLDEALASHETALALKPGYELARTEVLALRAALCRWDGADKGEGLGIEGAAVPPFPMLNLLAAPQDQLLCARNWAQARFGQIRPPIPCQPAARDGKIRIGYFSADFHNHATMYLIARLFELHDKSRFEVHAFSYGPNVQDAMRQRLCAAVDAFHDVSHLGDEAIAALARSQGIDIAVDLKGYTQDGRCSLFAHRAAPIQVAYLGYPGTSGTDFIDHIIADRIVLPEAHQAHFSERVAYLPHCYQVNDDRRVISDRQFSRAELGLPEQGFVFCSFNNSYKITPAAFDIWMRLLAQVPGSVLWQLQDNRWAADNLRSEAAARGIDPARIVFAERMPLADHLARHRHADLFLDTFQINAHTTASDALWAGLPVVTRLGTSFVGRVCASLLTALDLPDLVTDSAEGYEQLALDLARDPQRLAQVKGRLVANRTTAPLFDSARFTRDLEQLYEGLLAG